MAERRGRDSYIQTAFQEYLDNAVSKTVNLPSDATEQEVEKTFRLTYEFGCKGTTVYRDASRVDDGRIITASNKIT